MVLTQRRRDYESVIRIGERLLEARPQSPSILGELTPALVRMGRAKDALERIDEYDRAYGAPIDLLERGMNIASRHASAEAAAHWLERVLARDPKSTVGLLQDYNRHTWNGDYEAAANAVLSIEFRANKPLRPVYSAVFRAIRSDEIEHAVSLLEDMEGAKALHFERKLISAVLAISRRDLAGAEKLVSEAAADAQSDRRLAVVLSLLAEAYSADDGSQDHTKTAKFAAWADDEFTKPIPTASQTVICKAREKLDTILATPKSQRLLQDQPAMVSFICPVHRSRDVKNLVDQLQRQKWTNAEAVFYPNGEVTREQILHHWDQNSEIEPVFVDSGNPTNVGGFLNEILAACKGDYLCRIDADCWYLPNYTGHMICCLEHARADVIAIASMIRLLEELDVATLNPFGPILEPVEFRSGGGGATFLFHRRVIEKCKFPLMRAGEDTAFLAASQKAGFKAFYGAPFNFVAVRAADKDLHTWNVPDVQILFQGKEELIRNGEDLAKFVQHPSQE